MPTVDLGSVVGPQGPQGATGPQGPQGIQGETGPNAVSAETNTNLTGLLYGNGSKVVVVASELTEEEIEARLDVIEQISQIPRPNLLDNAYFVGGGSQQGTGAFPINQRAGYIVPGGVTYYSDNALTTSAGTISEYTTAVYVNTTYGTIDVSGTTYYVAYGDMVPGYAKNGYGIDRWEAWSLYGGASVILSPTYLSFISDGEWSQLGQRIEGFATKYAGRTLIISILFEGQPPEDTYIRLQNNDGRTVRVPINSEFFETSFICASVATNMAFQIINGTAGATINIRAIKLELGEHQTLAHQENGVWLLNEVPNFQNELAKCQRYQYIPRPVIDWMPIGWAQCVSQSELIVTANLPVPLRLSHPSVEVPPLFRVSSGSNDIVITDATCSAQRACGTLIRMDFDIPSPNTSLSAGNMYLVTYRFDTATPFVIDANT